MRSVPGITPTFINARSGRSTNKKSNICFLLIHAVWSKLRNKLPLPILVLLSIESLWIYYDSLVTSKEHHRPKRKPIIVTESSPISPYYNDYESYSGYSRIFPVIVPTETDRTDISKVYPYCTKLMKQNDMYSRSAIEEGIIFIKEMEVGSTLFASVTARIADRIGQKLKQLQQQQNGTICSARLMPMRARKFQTRIPSKSFLWSVLQEPINRVVHKAYQYAMLRRKISPDHPTIDDVNLFQDIVLNFEGQDYGYYIRSLAVKQKLNPYNIDEHHLYVQEILDSYDLLGIQERHHETLAVLQIILGLDVQDVLYLQSPNVFSLTGTNTNDNDISNHDDQMISQTDIYEQWIKGECRGIPVPQITFEMKKWFYSEEFERFVEADVLLYKAVNRSLDNTIEAIGRSRVDKSVKQIQWAIQKAKEVCQPQVIFPCSLAYSSSGGKVNTKTDCYFSDVGCGHSCLDQFGESLLKNAEFQKFG